MSDADLSEQADVDARRAATGLGRLIVTTTALALIAAAIVTATPLAGTIWPALMAGAGIALLTRLLWVAGRTEVTS